MTHTVSVGIDVSKANLDVTLLTLGKTTHRKFSNTTKGINTLEKFLVNNSIHNQCPIVMESTGDYHLLCAFQLIQRNYNVKVINPLIAKHHMITTVRKVKTDKVDSYLLAELGLKQELPTLLITQSSIHKRKLISFIDTLEKHKSALKLSLKNLKKTFTNFGIESQVILKLEQECKQLERIIIEAHQELSTLVESKELVASLKDIVGISELTANKIVAILEDRKFSSKKAMVAFAGLDISVKESGLWRGRGKISKRGNPQLRKYLVQVGWGLLMHNKSFQLFIEKYKQKGRKYLELLVIIARKFLCMLYGAMQSNKKFDVNFI